MATYTQADRPMAVKTPLGEDVLLLVRLTGREHISQLFHYHLDLIAPIEKNVAMDKLIGQAISVELQLPDGGTRYFSGICVRMSQGEDDGKFIAYQMVVAPKVWLLTKQARSRIFQHQSVPDILAEVFAGFNVEYQIQGTFHPRDYCTQYRETDFAFASRLMEEEGIYYYFKHDASGHKMVLANTPSSHADVNPSQLIFEPVTGGHRPENRVYAWNKSQELTTGKYTLWDYCFEMPGNHLESSKPVLQTVAAGTVTHKLKVGGNDRLEIYDYPGGYAQRFDGVDKGGGEQPSEVEKIFEDNARTVGIRMQQEEVPSLLVTGESNCRQLVAGHKFNLTKHPHADGSYVLTAVTHSATNAAYRSGSTGDWEYENTFECIPLALPYRPPRITPKPIVHGSQTAVVVGPAGEEIFTDKYGRVKVQFHWDREGQKDADSSCWIRVGTLWAGKRWGTIFLPRIGHEVIVDFLEGDPDRPIIVGSVYNADAMPPYTLPDEKTKSTIKTRSTLEGTEQNFNEIRFEDKKGSEQLFIHAEKNQDIEVENDETHWVGHDRTKTVDHDETTHVKHDRTERVDNNETITIGNNRTERVKKNETIAIDASRTEEVKQDESVTIGNNRMVSVEQNESLSVGENRAQSVGKNDALDVGKNLAITAGDQITLTTGSASIVMKKNGDILIKGKNIKIEGSGKINVKATSDVIVKGAKIAQN